MAGRRRSCRLRGQPEDEAAADVLLSLLGKEAGASRPEARSGSSRGPVAGASCRTDESELDALLHTCDDEDAAAIDDDDEEPVPAASETEPSEAGDHMSDADQGGADMRPAGRAPVFQPGEPGPDVIDMDYDIYIVICLRNACILCEANGKIQQERHWQPRATSHAANDFMAKDMSNSY